MQAQRDSLRRVFAERLLALHPARHLDVGSGNGELVRASREAGVFAIGVEPASPALGPGEPYPALRAAAAALPFADGSFDWVSLRHVPHHLENLPAALSEAWRVASRGLLIAEPWFDETRTDQRFALRADRWLKRQDRRQGRYHADAMSSDQLRAALPEAARCEVETCRPERPWTRDELKSEALRTTGDLPLAAEDERELDNLLDIADRGRMSLPGTLILTVRKG